MPPIRRRVLLATVLSVAAFGPASLAAQTASQGPPQTPPVSIPGLERFSLPGVPQPAPTPSPTPVPPVTTPTPAAVATLSPAAVATPSPRSTPRPTPTPTAAPPPEPTPAPVAPIAPAAAPTPEPLATPVPAEPATQAAADGAPAWPWWLGGGALALLGGWLTLRRRREGQPEARFVEPAEQPIAPATPPPPPAPRARLALDLRPTRAGINLLSATVDCEVSVTNTGDAPAEGIRIGVRLFSAHADQDAELAAYQAQPVARPAVPPFGLAPGETRTLRAVAALPHVDIRPLSAAGRPMFVPVIALNALYSAAEDLGGQTARSFAVGIERADSPKLAPFWLDQPPRTVTEVAARAHGAAIETDQPH
ncbi:hypothetical protein [uncultured Sphingomonas sp.]|uniref:hypothetical protein n=1 Tax=uncultured Sphingomonas sp. TaxID=158754 RepID=UPI0035CC65E4